MVNAERTLMNDMWTQDAIGLIDLLFEPYLQYFNLVTAERDRSANASAKLTANAR